LKASLFNSESWFKRAFPVLSTFIPKANAESLTFLLTSAMLGRFLVGATRCVADWPTLNTKENETPNQKTDTALERVFMEGVGVPANFAAIALGQNAGFRLGEFISPNSRPENFINTLDESLSPHYKRAMVYTFNTGTSKRPITLNDVNALNATELEKALQAITNPLHKTLYENAKINRFTDALDELLPKDTPLPLKDVKSIAGFFKSNNLRTNICGITGGMVASTLFSGIVWQWMNDTLIRKHLVPPLSQTLTPVLFGTTTTPQSSTPKPPNPDPLKAPTALKRRSILPVGTVASPVIYRPVQPLSYGAGVTPMRGYTS
jgi:hypothetical protein